MEKAQTQLKYARRKAIMEPMQRLDYVVAEGLLSTGAQLHLYAVVTLDALDEQDADDWMAIRKYGQTVSVDNVSDTDWVAFLRVRAALNDDKRFERKVTVVPFEALRSSSSAVQPALSCSLKFETNGHGTILENETLVLVGRSCNQGFATVCRPWHLLDRFTDEEVRFDVPEGHLSRKAELVVVKSSDPGLPIGARIDGINGWPTSAPRHFAMALDRIRSKGDSTARVAYRAPAFDDLLGVAGLPEIKKIYTAKDGSSTLAGDTQVWIEDRFARQPWSAVMETINADSDSDDAELEPEPEV
eukprot:COSAG06_NODE_484_length_15127_cov_3.402116_4_plen_301_part_00